MVDWLVEMDFMVIYLKDFHRVLYGGQGGRDGSFGGIYGVLVGCRVGG